ncbi:MAG: hypothetical protein FD137_691 [Spirochaetes bacterium]|nr:MAG: hypothetical protein FD137_691 [Spirochaetota bacterium]
MAAMLLSIVTNMSAECKEVSMSRKKISVLVVIVVAVSLLFSCAEGKKTVGLAKFVAHLALDAVEQGIVDVLRRGR